MTAQKQGERKVFHLLHGKPPGVAKTRPLHDDDRKGTPSASDVVILLPSKKDSEEGILVRGIDPRDERVLVVWDGALLPNGLPRGSAIVHQVTLCENHALLSRWPYYYEVSWGQAYKKRETDPDPELFLPQHFMDISGAGFGVQEICRFFVLMRSDRTATVLRFDDKRLAPRYVFVEVEKGGKSVRWRQSSY